MYGNDPNQFRGNNQPQIQEGAVVIQRQKIFSLPDVLNMQVNTKVHESMIDRVEPGQVARIRVDAFAGEPLTGKVKSVQPLPDPTSFFSSDVKVYTTLVTIDQKMQSLRPGMTAEVTILIDTLDDVLVIPVTAVLPLKGKEYVYVVTPDGKPERREVTLGATNDILIEVKEGLKEGDLVAMNPTSLLSESEKNEAFSATVRASSKARDFGDAKNPPKAEGGAGGDEKAKTKARTKGAGGAGGPGGFGGAGAAMFQKFRNITPEDREKLKTASDEEKKEIMRKAGFTDEELQQMEQMRQQMQQGGGGGFGGPPGGGFGGGGFGGPPGGGGGFGGPPGGGAPGGGPPR